MFGILVFASFYAFLREEDRRIHSRMERRIMRDASNPFHISDSLFLQLFRLPQDMAFVLIEDLQPFLQRRRASGISVEFQVLCALRFYAEGSYQVSIGQDFRLPMSQSTVSKCISDVSRAISQIMHRYIVFPLSEGARVAAQRKFESAAQPFPHTIGAIDCTHVRIVRPQQEEHAFLNRHGYHSMNVQVVCDPDMIILSIFTGHGGSRHDAGIWRDCLLREVVATAYNAGNTNSWLIGDSGYPLEPWLLTPHPNPVPNSPEDRYTQSLCKARTVIERCFGVLKATFRCLSFQRVLMYNPERASSIINSCCVLHNLRVRANLLPEENVIREERDFHVNERRHDVREASTRGEGARTRRRLIAEIYS